MFRWNNFLVAAMLSIMLVGCGGAKVKLEGEILSAKMVEGECIAGGDIPGICTQDYDIDGWACLPGNTEYVQLELLAKVDGDSEVVKTGLASQYATSQNTSAIEEKCENDTTQHGFKFTFEDVTSIFGVSEDAIKLDSLDSGTQISVRALAIPDTESANTLLSNPLELAWLIPFDSNKDDLKTQWEEIQEVAATATPEQITALFHPKVQERYAESLSFLEDGEVGEIFLSLENFKPLKAGATNAEAMVTRMINGEKYAFVISFTKDENEAWRISGM